MAKILGLDLGTNSIGWALLDQEKEGNKLEDKGVLIFSEGVKKEKGQEKSKAAERTGFRSGRRIKFRRKIRKYQTLMVLAKYNMCPLSINEVKEWRQTNFKKYPAKPEFLEWLRTDEDKNIIPYYFRDKASRLKVHNYELGRAMYHIAQRRGFLSNRLDQSDKGIIEKHQPELETIILEGHNNQEIYQLIIDYFEPFDIIEKKQKDLNAGENELKKLYNSFSRILKEKIELNETKQKLLGRLYKKENLGAVKKNITELDTAIKEAGCKTLGQYFWSLYQQDRNNSENKIRSNYTSREDHYLNEFEVICKIQGLEGINNSKKDPGERYSGIVKELYKAIFYQRPLKSQKGLIGKCSLEPKKSRCSVSRPEYKLFRMYSFINTIKIQESGDEGFRFLTDEEREKIKPKFLRKSKPTFSFIDIKKTLGEENKYNFKDNATVSGCPTIAALINVFGENWENTIYENYTDKRIKNTKNNKPEEVKSKEQVIADIWHVLATYTSDEKLIDFAINKLKMNKQDAEKFSKIHLKKDYASLSLFAINKILPYLEKGLLYSHAVFMANMDKLIKQERWTNELDRTLIEKEVGQIINNHQEENKIYFAVNSALKYCFDNNQTYSREAEISYKSDVEKHLKKEFGERTWEDKPNKENLFSKAFEIFIKQLKDRKHAAIKRIDEKIMEFLSDNDLIRPNLSSELYHPSDIEKFKPATLKDKNGNKFNELGSPDVGSIKNPMVMRALHQLKKLINTLILEGQIDENTKVNIELSRQLNDANKRKAIEKWQNDRKELFQEYEKKIKELYKIETGNDLKEVTDEDIEKFGYALEQRKDGEFVSKEDVMKYTLWEEQNHVCLYTGKTISLSSFLGTNPQFDIEHTLPRSRSWDNSQMNKTLCDRAFNQKTKGNKMPFELQMDDEIMPRIQHWKNKYESLANEIEKKIRSTRSATDKEQKDKLIQQRHYLKLEFDYWKGKHDRFVMEEIKEGFKNSQAVDIGIISKYATAYLKSVFNKVYSVKGEMVSEYRKAWGLHDTYIDKLGRTQYKPKDRSNHIHHCIDAVTIACMNKNKYDKLAHAWGLADKGDYEKAKKELENEKPWDTFTQDVRNLENEVFIVHQNKDILLVQTKKKFRKRGKIQRDKSGNVIFQQGDTVRGSLHLDTFYGAIAKGKNGEIQKDDKGNIKPNYVVRKELSKLKKSDVVNIVDDGIRAIVEQAEKDKLITFNNNGAKVNETIWQNKVKQIPLKKVRIFTPSVKSPLKDFKKHPEHFRSQKPYKQQFNVVNEENYCMAIYEGFDKKGKLKRDFELVNNIDAGAYYKLSNKIHRENHELVPNPHLKSRLPLKYIIKKGMLVLMYDKSDDEIWELSKNQQLGRLYQITQLDTEASGIKLLHHQEARGKKELTEFMGLKNGMKGGKNLDLHKQFPWIKFSPANFDCIVEGVDFKITTSGSIKKM